MWPLNQLSDVPARAGSKKLSIFIRNVEIRPFPETLPEPYMGLNEISGCPSRGLYAKKVGVASPILTVLL